MADEFQARISAFLKGHGIENFSFCRRAKHPAVVINHRGVAYLHVFPSTPSDHRSLANTLRDLRHRLGLLAVSERKAEPPRKVRKQRRKAPAARAIRPPPRLAAAPKEDRYYDRLAALRLQLLAASVPEDGPPAGTAAFTAPPARQRLRTPFLGHRARFQEEVRP